MQRADVNIEIIQHIQNGNVTAVDDYIKADKNRLNQPIDNDGNTLLQMAVIAKKPELVTTICKYPDVNYDATNDAGQNVLGVCKAQLDQYPADDTDNIAIRKQIVEMRKTITESLPGAIVQIDAAENFRQNNNMRQFAKAMTQAGDDSVVKLMGGNLAEIKKALADGSMKKIAPAMLMLQDMKDKRGDILSQSKHAGMNKEFIKLESALQDAMLVAVKKFADEVRPLVAEQIKEAANKFKLDYGKALLYSAQARDELTKVTREIGTYVRVAQEPQASKSAPDMAGPAPPRDEATRAAMTNYLKEFTAIMNNDKLDNNGKLKQMVALKAQHQDLVKSDKAVEGMTNAELRRLEQSQQRRGSLAPAKRIESASPSPSGTPTASPAIRRKPREDAQQEGQEVKSAPTPSRRP